MSIPKESFHTDWEASDKNLGCWHDTSQQSEALETSELHCHNAGDNLAALHMLTARCISRLPAAPIKAVTSNTSDTALCPYIYLEQDFAALPARQKINW